LVRSADHGRQDDGTGAGSEISDARSERPGATDRDGGPALREQCEARAGVQDLARGFDMRVDPATAPPDRYDAPDSPDEKGADRIAIDRLARTEEIHAWFDRQGKGQDDRIEPRAVRRGSHEAWTARDVLRPLDVEVEPKRRGDGSERGEEDPPFEGRRAARRTARPCVWRPPASPTTRAHATARGRAERLMERGG